MIKLEEVAALLHIHKEALGHGAALTNIRDAAYKRLLELNVEMAAKPESTYVPTALDKELAGTEAGNKPDVEPIAQVERRDA